MDRRCGFPIPEKYGRLGGLELSGFLFGSEPNRLIWMLAKPRRVSGSSDIAN